MFARVLWMFAAALAVPAMEARGEWLAPLYAETAETVGSGNAEVGLGASYFNGRRFPPFTPQGFIRSQDLVTGPEFGFRVAPADAVEIQASYELIYLNEDTTNGHNSEYGGGDARLFTKIWAVRERKWIPGTGVRFGVKLPNASKEKRLGTDETDFYIQALGSKRFGQIATHLNLGLAILGNPGFGTNSSDGQDDLFIYDFAVVSPTFGQRAAGWAVRGLLEISGATGSRFDNDFTEFRGGPQVMYGNWTFYLGGSAGLEGAAAHYGVSGGAFYTFALERLAALFDED
ncbi:MAG: hypothetical protein AB7V27_12060 [Candidatus Binatia bacterium]